MTLNRVHALVAASLVAACSDGTSAATADASPDAPPPVDVAVGAPDVALDPADSAPDVAQPAADLPPVDAAPVDVAPADVAPVDAPAASPPYDRAVFRATHNSYSGDINGQRGTIARQLDHGVRFVEFDVHDNDYRAEGYQVGHGPCVTSPQGPGCEVDHAGDNPDSNRLRDWLRVVSTWSQAHRAHAPLAVAFDIKDDLTDNPSYADGNLAALNDLVRASFGEALLPSSEVAAAWPTVDALRGRVLVVLSGDGATRVAYRRDQGRRPAVAMNTRGVVIEAHDDGANGLWYWTGRYQPDGTVRWARHGRYDTGSNPAVAINDDGWVVEVHEAVGGRLFYNVGRVDASLEVSFGASGERYDTGVTPTLRFASPAGLALREVHASEVTPSQHWEWQATLDVASRTVRWSDASHGRTGDALYDKTTASNGGARVRVSTGVDGAAPADTLRYDTDRVGARRVQYEQLMFVEFQRGDDAEVREGARFYAANASPRDAFGAFYAAETRAGRLFRAWQTTGENLSRPVVSFPASDTPYAAWYDALCREAHCVE